MFVGKCLLATPGWLNIPVHLDKEVRRWLNKLHLNPALTEFRGLTNIFVISVILLKPVKELKENKLKEL